MSLDLSRVEGPSPARRRPRRRRERSGIPFTAIRVAVYLAALLPIVLIYSTKERALYIAPPIGLVGFGAAWVLLRETPVAPKRRLLYAAGIGVMLAELTWALGYWTLVPAVGGALLWLALYVLSGVADHGLSGALDRRVGLEYALVGGLGLLLVLFTVPWRT